MAPGCYRPPQDAVGDSGHPLLQKSPCNFCISTRHPGKRYKNPRQGRNPKLDHTLHPPPPTPPSGAHAPPTPPPTDHPASFSPRRAGMEATASGRRSPRRPPRVRRPPRHLAPCAELLKILELQPSAPSFAPTRRPALSSGPTTRSRRPTSFFEICLFWSPSVFLDLESFFSWDPDQFLADVDLCNKI
jgi:hypothetical protein